MRDGVATNEDLARLQRWSVVLRGRGACATLDAATNVAASLLDQFPQTVPATSTMVATHAKPARSGLTVLTRWRR